MPNVTPTAFPTTMPPPVAIDNLSLSYAGRPVLNQLNWQLPAGQVVGLLGRNGAGKTTLLEAMLGLREGATGQVRLFGQPVDALDDATRARIGYVPQHSQLFEWMTPLQLLAYFKSFYPRWNDAKVDALLTRWGIDRNQTIGQLSGGQQQRLSIIRALGHEPDLLVLDEPVASLDPAGRRDFLQALAAQVTSHGTTVVFSTHILSDLESVAFNVAFLSSAQSAGVQGGRIALQAPLNELMARARRVTGPMEQVCAWAQTQAPAGWQVLSTTALGNGQTQVLVYRAQAEAASTSSIGPAGAAVDAASLEDLFLALAV